MKTNDLKKGHPIKLRNGWNAKLFDNKKGNIRLAEVYGDYTELGSIYTHDIVAYLDENRQWKDDIELTKSQIACLKAVNKLSF